ncbi:AAA family ATPase [Amycolatopsis pigmentata]|uniref:AAA family ATPase n=1 Tax=Amycolatopsis pigmentata TaxID=450801 RepID=A0ABW5G1B7_9PSEU
MTTPPAPTTAHDSAASPALSVGRLRNGELRAMVARALADHAGWDFTPRAIAQFLGRSSGAVANALKVLAERGEAEVFSTMPLKYRATPTTSSAAAATITPGRAPSAPRTRRPRTTTSTPTVVGLSTPAASVVVTGPVPRPNGTDYHPRLLSGIPDVTALRKLREAGVAALMYGPPGTGKTSVVEAAFPDLLTVQGDGDTTVADLVGEYTQTGDGRYVFIHGPLVRAMREGRTLFIDDATLIPPTVLAVVYPAMDGRRQIVVKANGGEIVDAAPGFYVVAGHNPGVHGAVLTDALSSRFAAQIHVSTDYDLATQLDIDKRAVKIARNLATRHEKGEVGWAPQLRELLAFQKIAEVLGADAAAGNLIGTAPEDDRPTVAAVVRQVFGKELAPLALGTRI